MGQSRRFKIHNNKAIDIYQKFPHPRILKKLKTKFQWKKELFGDDVHNSKTVLSNFGEAKEAPIVNVFSELDDLHTLESMK